MCWRGLAVLWKIVGRTCNVLGLRGDRVHDCAHRGGRGIDRGRGTARTGNAECGDWLTMTGRIDKATSPRRARAAIRAGEWTATTTGLCGGYVQANLAILP